MTRIRSDDEDPVRTGPKSQYQIKGHTCLSISSRYHNQQPFHCHFVCVSVSCVTSICPYTLWMSEHLLHTQILSPFDFSSLFVRPDSIVLTDFYLFTLQSERLIVNLWKYKHCSCDHRPLLLFFPKCDPHLSLILSWRQKNRSHNASFLPLFAYLSSTTTLMTMIGQSWMSPFWYK